MKLISWNVNGIRALEKKGGWSYLERSGADIFCVQETKAKMDQLSPEVRSPAGYFSYFDHSRTKKGYSGTAIFSRVEPTKVTYGLDVASLDQEGRLITAHYKDFVLINCYFPNGGMGPHRLEFKMAYYKAFLKYVNRLARETNVIFCGDVNTAHEPIDLARPKENEKNSGFLRMERDWLDAVASDGWVDTFRYIHPDETGAYTYWDMKTGSRARNVGWRIDYFYVNKEFASHLANSSIDSEVYGSDHCPIILDTK